jgi:hypothetical protein
MSELGRPIGPDDVVGSEGEGWVDLCLSLDLRGGPVNFAATGYANGFFKLWSMNGPEFEMDSDTWGRVGSGLAQAGFDGKVVTRFEFVPFMAADEWSYALVLVFPDKAELLYQSPWASGRLVLTLVDANKLGRAMGDVLEKSREKGWIDAI